MASALLLVLLMALALGQAQQFFLRLQLALHLRSLKLTLQRGQTCLLFLRLYLLGYRPEDTLGSGLGSGLGSQGGCLVGKGFELGLGEQRLNLSGNVHF